MTDTNTLVFDTTPFATEYGTGQMICERISPAIAVIPGISSDRKFTGQFLISTASGYSLTNKGACIRCAREAAGLLASIDVDWSDREIRDKVTPDQMDAIRCSMAAVFACVCEGNCETEALVDEGELIAAAADN